MDPQRASYGVADYLFAISQLAQTTLRSEIGKIVLDRTFEERTTINVSVVTELDKASDPWGIKILRYEIKNINPPTDVLAAMEKQMRAEREKRAVILTSATGGHVSRSEHIGSRQSLLGLLRCCALSGGDSAENGSNCTDLAARATDSDPGGGGCPPSRNRLEHSNTPQVWPGTGLTATISLFQTQIMALERGTRLGPYQIESPIGAGGMGEACKGCVTGPAGVGSLVWV